jgi:hypothetical protein
MAQLAKELCHLLDIKQNISTAYHPQTDGQSECSNQWLEQYVRIYTNYQQTDWAAWLPLAQYVHNSWTSSTTKKTPFDLLMGYCHGSKGPWLEVSVDVTCSAQVLSAFTRQREDSQDERGKQAWIGDKVETGVSTLCNYSFKYDYSSRLYASFIIQRLACYDIT